MAYSEDALQGTYAAETLADQGDVHVTFLRLKVSDPQAEWGAVNYLMITKGAVVYMEKLSKGWIGQVTAQIADMGKEPVVFCFVEASTTNQSGYYILKLYGVSGDTISQISDTLSPPGPGPTVVVDPKADSGWKRAKVVSKADSQDFKDAHIENVLYVNYDAAQSKYVPENYGARFEQKEVTVEDPIMGSYKEPYFQLSDDKVNLRNSPSRSGTVLQALPRKSLFDIIDRSDDSETIGGVTERWYKVLLQEGTTEGWIFGGFIKRKTG
jgi:hypothetical protein